MRDNASALRRNTTPMTPPTVQPKKRNVAASSIGDPIEVKGFRPPKVRAGWALPCAIRLTDSVRPRDLLGGRAQDLYVGIERVRRPLGTCARRGAAGSVAARVRLFSLCSCRRL